MIIIMKIKCHGAVNSNNVLAPPMFRLLHDYWVTQCVNDLEPLRKSNYSGLSEWMVTKFNRGANFDGLGPSFGRIDFFVECGLLLFKG